MENEFRDLGFGMPPGSGGCLLWGGEESDVENLCVRPREGLRTSGAKTNVGTALAGSSTQQISSG